MHGLHPLQQLVRNLQHSFQGETPAALREQVFQRRSQEVHNHCIVAIVGSVVVNLNRQDEAESDDAPKYKFAREVCHLTWTRWKALPRRHCGSMLSHPSESWAIL